MVDKQRSYRVHYMKLVDGKLKKAQRTFPKLASEARPFALEQNTLGRLISLVNEKGTKLTL